MKLKRTTKIVIITSWILFFCTCFFIFSKLNQVKESKVTNDKIFQENHKIKSTTEEEKTVQKEDVISFMKEYYQALEAGNANKVYQMVEDSKTMKKRQTVSKLKTYIESYQNLHVTVEDGLDENSFLVYVTYDTKIKDIKTLAPALARYYVQKKGSTFILYNNDTHYTQEMKDLVKENLRKDGIKEMIQTTNEAYEHAINTDKELRDFFKSSGS